MNEPTEIQLAIFHKIQRFYIDNMYPPTIQDVADIMGYTKPNTYGHIVGMRKKKMFLHKTKLIPVGIEVVKNT